MEQPGRPRHGWAGRRLSERERTNQPLYQCINRQTRLTPSEHSWRDGLRAVQTFAYQERTRDSASLKSLRQTSSSRWSSRVTGILTRDASPRRGEEIAVLLRSQVSVAPPQRNLHKLPYSGHGY